VPGIVEQVVARWALRPGEPFEPELSSAWVVPVVRADDTRAALKVALPHMEAEHEIAGLEGTAGHRRRPPSRPEPSSTATVPRMTAPLERKTPTDPPAARAPHRLIDTSGWRAAAREFAVIVTGVLVALGAQAWWESRQEHQREREYLRQLLSDIRVNERRLAEAIAQDSAGGAAVTRVLETVDGAGPPPPADSLVGWVSQAGSASDFQPLTGTYRALLGTGDLRLVRNDSLRALIVSYAAAMDREEARLLQYREVILQSVGPLARTMPFMRSAFRGGPDPTRVDVAALRADPEAATLAFTLQAANRNRLAGLRRARDETQRMGAALSAEPGVVER